jgi:F-type H+-transporting ATPase subunit b
MDILKQLGDLFVQAIPTIIIVFLFSLFLRWSFFAPIAKVMAERAARTEGAQREAVEAKAAAVEKIRTYEDALKKARGTVYAEQDARRKTILDERATMIRDARKVATERVAQAKEIIAKEAAVTRAQLEAESPALAEEIVEAVFARRPEPGGGSVQGGAR